MTCKQGRGSKAIEAALLHSEMYLTEAQKIEPYREL